jgi:hypothetical protein
MRLAFLLGVSVLWGCSSGDNTATDSGTDGSVNDVNTQNDGGKDGAVDTGSDGSSGNDSGGDGGFNPTCGTTSLNSTCSNQASIVQTVAKLGNGLADQTGTLTIHLNHYRLGNGSTGGVPHTQATKASVTVGTTTTATLDVDMCTGSAMWNEDDCEFYVSEFLDKNGNGTIDPGEPAGHAVVALSCKNAGPTCIGVVLDCVAGASCGDFVDPGVCKCATTTCNSAGKYCTP